MQEGHVLVDGLIFIALVGAIIYFVIGRSSEKKLEKFEKRDW